MCAVRKSRGPGFWSNPDGLGRSLRFTDGMIRSAASGGSLRRAAGIAGLLWLCVHPSPAGCGNSDEFECEEAATHVENCCQYSTSLRCDYVDSSETTSDGCTTYKKYRHIDIDLQPYSSRCVRQASCDDLRAAGACGLRSWYQQETCSESRQCTGGGGLSSSCGSWLVTSVCKTPSQSGPCISYRPPDACEVLARLACE